MTSSIVSEYCTANSAWNDRNKLQKKNIYDQTFMHVISQKQIEFESKPDLRS